MDFNGKTFAAGERAIVDGNSFTNCTFETGSILEVFGEKGAHFEGCRFGVPRLELNGNTIAAFSLLRVLYHMPGGPELVGAILSAPLVNDPSG